ncbi:hypothetical protein BH09MYX1_BH09MYX1_40410 [soil metagenome]
MTRSRLHDGANSLPFAASLFFASLLPRLWVALHFAAEPVWDGHYYDFGARQIALGTGYADQRIVDGIVEWHPWCHYPVGYSFFLSVFYRLFGSDLRVAAVVNAVVSALVPVVTFVLATRIFSPNRARIAGIIAAAHPGLILYSALVMTEPLSALSTLLAFVLATQGKERRWFVLGALLIGLSALVRPQALLCAPALAFADSAPKLPRLRFAARLPAALAACVLALLPVLPWTARNCKVMDGCALVSTNAGWNLAIGAFPRATGRFETLKATDGCREVTGQVQQDRCWFNYGVSEIESHPAHWLALVPKKLGYTFDHESFAVEYLHEARPAAWPEERRANGRALTTYSHRILLAAAALGVGAFVLGKRRRHVVAQGVLLLGVIALWIYAFTPDPAFWPLAVFLAVAPWLPTPGRPQFGPELKMGLVLFGTTLVTHAIFFGEDRYHMVLTPVLCLFAAGALRRPAPERPAV